MAIELSDIDFVANIFRNSAFVILYLFIGFGPGFVFGILLANRIWGRGEPSQKQISEEGVEKGIAHNQQWHPDEDRWHT